MSKNQRIVLFIFYLCALVLLGFCTKGEISDSNHAVAILFSSLLMLAFVTLFIEHFFTRPTDVSSSAISILLLLTPLQNELGEFGVWYYIFYGYSLLMLVVSFIALLFADTNKPQDSKCNRISYHLKNFSTQFGNGRFLYFILFMLTLIFYVKDNNKYLIVLFIFSTIILLTKPQEYLGKLLTEYFQKKSQKPSSIGEIFGVQSENTFLAKLYDERSAINRFDFVEFCYKMDRKTYRGMITGTYFLNQAQWIKILRLEDTTKQDKSEKAAYNIVKKIKCEILEKHRERLIGLTVENTDISKLKFEYVGKQGVSEGDILEARFDEKIVFYQIIEGTTNTEILESKDERGLIIGEAIQLGTWNEEKAAFEKFGWVPTINTPIYLCKDEKFTVIPKENEYIAGYAPPKETFPIIMNRKDAISHHLAILGVTGAGKSIFARDFIKKLTDDNVKVICVDFTHEYKNYLKHVLMIETAEEQRKMFNALSTLEQEMAKFKSSRDKDKIKNQETEIKDIFEAAIRKFLASENKISIFELPDVGNTFVALDYTRWFFNILFEFFKQGNTDKKLCIVLEEAHTVIPEWNFIGSTDQGARNLVNNIGQIALQGRKYGVGFIVIAQRTANVSKTILTQCNSIIAFQQFDTTGTDFLSAYMGKDFAESLPRLEPRHAIAVGKAFRSNTPVMFRVPNIEEQPHESDCAPTSTNPPASSTPSADGG